MESVYSFRSKPKIIVEERAPAEESRAKFGGCNLMYDRRVRRGRAYKHFELPEPEPMIRVQLKRPKRVIAVQRHPKLPVLPPLEAGKRRMEVDVSDYLVERKEDRRCVDEGTQVDALEEKPPSPAFVPKKTGMNRETQIYPGDLFGFDESIYVIIDVINNKVLEQATFEVVEEEDLATRRENQRVYEENRYQEIRDREKLELLERQYDKEKRRLMEEKRNQLEKQKETNDKIAALVYSHDYVKTLVTNVHGELREKGFFFDPVLRAVKETFLPSIIEDVINPSYNKNKNFNSNMVQESKPDFNKGKSNLFSEQEHLERNIIDYLIRKTVAERYDAYKYGPALSETVYSAESSRCSCVGLTTAINEHDTYTTEGLNKKKNSRVLDAPHLTRFSLDNESDDENDIDENEELTLLI